MSEEHWSQNCYTTVDLETMEDDGELDEHLQLCSRISEGSWEWVIPAESLVQVGMGDASPAVTALSLVNSLLDENAGDRGTEEFDPLSDIFNFNRSEIISGKRRPWVEGEDDGIEQQIENAQDSGYVPGSLTRLFEFDDGGGQLDAEVVRDVLSGDDSDLFDREYVGELSTNDVYKAIHLAVVSNRRADDRELEGIYIGDESPDLTRPVISVGGPVSNFYTRRLMYGDEFELPYRFDLNPDNVAEDLSKLSPAELQKRGVRENDEFDDRPQWKLVDQAGTPPRVEGTQTVPERSSDGSGWKRDYFTVLKLPNVFAADPGSTDALVFAGCHGRGTRAAVDSALRGSLRDHLTEHSLRDGYFQVVGRVAPGKAESVVVSDDHTADLGDRVPERWA